MTGTDQAAPGAAPPNGAGAASSDAAGAASSDAAGAAPNDNAGTTPNAADPNGGDVDTNYKKFLACAATLSKAADPNGSSVGGSQMLLDQIANARLPTWTDKPLTTAIGNATGLDAGDLLKDLRKIREALSRADDPEDVKARLPFAEDPDPDPNPMPIGNLLDQIMKIVTARVYCSTETAIALALWDFGTWGVFPPSDPTSGPFIYPLMGITGPMKRCGKTTALESIQVTVRRPLAAADISQAALYRSIEKYRPTLLIDEFDQLIKKNPDLIGLLNSAHTRNGTVIRTVEVQVDGKKTFEPVPFSTFSPILLAGIGDPPSTIADRMVRARLERQPRGHNRRRVSGRQLRAIRDMLIPHCAAHADALGAAMAAGVPDSAIPTALNDRDADNWTPLLAIATLAGGNWLARAQCAAVLLCAESVDAANSREWLFAQIVEAVEALRRTTVEEYLAWRRGGRKPLPMQRPGVRRPTWYRYAPSDDIATWLMGKDDSGFAGMRDLGSVKLRVARTLRPFKVTPKLRKVNAQAVRGYDVAQLRAAWRQYRP